MSAKDSNDPLRGAHGQEQKRRGCTPASAVSTAINRGFVVGREVLVGSVPGIVVGYNIAGTGQFVGNAYPLVVRTALGVAKFGMDELSLA